MKHFFFFAQYNCDAYGANAFGECSTGTTAANNNNGWLANTGYDVIIPIALGLALVIAGSILLAKRLKRRFAK